MGVVQLHAAQQWDSYWEPIGRQSQVVKWFEHSIYGFEKLPIEQHVLDTNAEKQLS